MFFGSIWSRHPQPLGQPHPRSRFQYWFYFSIHCRSWCSSPRHSPRHSAWHRNIIIEGDNLLVINAVKCMRAPSCQIVNITKDIKLLLNQFDSWQLTHIFWEANRAAYWIINVGNLVTSSFMVAPFNNFVLFSILVTDALEVPSGRASPAAIYHTKSKKSVWCISQCYESRICQYSPF